MIKEYKTIKGRYNQPRKMAVIICDSCKDEFIVAEGVANEGRKYCSKECSDNGRGFKKGVKFDH